MCLKRIKDDIKPRILLRMLLKLNKFSKKITVNVALSGMILAIKLSVARNILKINIMNEIIKI